MADPRHIAPAVDTSTASSSGLEPRVLLTQSDFDALIRERLARVIEGPVADDGAGLGSAVRVSDGAGREHEYVLIGRRDEDSDRYEVTMASPVGKALWGARPGDVVTVALPDGRSRALHVLEIVHGSIVPSNGAARAA